MIDLPFTRIAARGMLGALAIATAGILAAPAASAAPPVPEEGFRDQPCERACEGTPFRKLLSRSCWSPQRARKQGRPPRPRVRIQLRSGGPAIDSGQEDPR